MASSLDSRQAFRISTVQTRAPSVDDCLICGMICRILSAFIGEESIHG